MQDKVNPGGPAPSDTLKKYKLRPEHRTLFENLATGKELTQGDAFHVAGGPKSYRGDDVEVQVARDAELLRKLMDAGVIEEIDTGVTYKPR